MQFEIQSSGRWPPPFQRRMCFEQLACNFAARPRITFSKGGTKACLPFAVQAGGICSVFGYWFMEFCLFNPPCIPLSRGDVLRTTPELLYLPYSDFRSCLLPLIILIMKNRFDSFRFNPDFCNLL